MSETETRWVRFTVHGVPAPQGSKTKMPNGAMVEANSKTGREKVKNWRSDVKDAALRAFDGELLDGPLLLVAAFRFQKPASRRKAEVWQSTKPDLSKLVRATEDAMKGIIWTDDARVSAVFTTKTYASSPHLPGADIFVCTLSHEDEVFLELPPTVVHALG